MAKINLAPKTRNLSISLPTELADKLNIFVSSERGLNISKTIRFVLEDFFANNGGKDLFPKLENNDFLVPVELYSEILGIGKAAVQTRAIKGQLEIVTLYDSDFIKAKKDDVINIFAQVLDLKKRVDDITETLLHMQENKRVAKLEKELKDLREICKEMKSEN